MASVIFEISKRLRQPKQQDAYISFVSRASTIGVGLGCAVLILLLSVMNGFEYELRNTLLRAVPHAEIFSINNKGLYPNPQFISAVEDDPFVSEVFLLNKAAGLLQAGKTMKAVSLVGIDKRYFDSKFAHTNGESYFSALSEKQNGVLLGRKILSEHNLTVGQKIQLLLPASSENLNFSAPRSAWVEIVGEVSVGGDVDKQLALLNRQFLADLLGLDTNSTHIEIQLHDPFNAYDLVREYGYGFDQAAYMSDWTRTNGHLYQDIQLIRVVVYIVLFLVIAVACFNIVSALIMSVKEKSKEIAILKTIGATSKQIASIFILKGLYHGLKGAVIGTIIGVLLALYLGEILSAVESLFGIGVFTNDVYFTSSIPSQLNWQDVAVTLLTVLFIACLATLYPAKKAADLPPAANLH